MVQPWGLAWGHRYAPTRVFHDPHVYPRPLEEELQVQGYLRQAGAPVLTPPASETALQVHDHQMQQFAAIGWVLLLALALTGLAFALVCDLKRPAASRRLGCHRIAAVPGARRCLRWGLFRPASALCCGSAVVLLHLVALHYLWPAIAINPSDFEPAGQRGSYSQMYQDVFVQAVAGYNNWTTGYYLVTMPVRIFTGFTTLAPTAATFLSRGARHQYH